MKSKIILVIGLGVFLWCINSFTPLSSEPRNTAKADTLVVDSIFEQIFPINLYDARSGQIRSLFKIPFREQVVTKTEIRVHTFTQGRNYLRLNYMLNDHGYQIDSLHLYDNAMRLGLGLKIGISRGELNRVLRAETHADKVVVFNKYQTMRCVFLSASRQAYRLDGIARAVCKISLLVGNYGIFRVLSEYLLIIICQNGLNDSFFCLGILFVAS